jgi:hypothetical protein
MKMVTESLAHIIAREAHLMLVSVLEDLKASSMAMTMTMTTVMWMSRPTKEEESLLAEDELSLYGRLQEGHLL